MSAGENYRIKAAEMRARARRETSESQRAEYLRLAQAYMRLSRQAELNQANDIVYETPPRDDGEHDAPPPKDGDR